MFLSTTEKITLLGDLKTRIINIGIFKFKYIINSGDGKFMRKNRLLTAQRWVMLISGLEFIGMNSKRGSTFLEIEND